MTDAPSVLPKAKTIAEALPYLKRFAGETFVIKYGGSVMEDEALSRQFANDVVLLKYVGINPVVVHGGGKEITKWMKKLGQEATFIDGLRFTDKSSIEIIEMVLCGNINGEIVTQINQSGGKAVGLSGKDANLFSAHKIRGRDNKDLGLVGEIESTDIGILKSLCADGYIPVVASVAGARDGQTLNLNADHVAGGIAAALKAMKLILLTDVTGITIGGEVLKFIDLTEAEALLDHPEITSGMRPKLENSIRALKGEVKSVHIIDGRLEHALLLEIFTDSGIGTMLSNEQARV